MRPKNNKGLDPKKRYLQIALNGTSHDAEKIISQLPISDRIILEAGTPLIKRYGINIIREMYGWYEMRHMMGQGMSPAGSAVPERGGLLGMLVRAAIEAQKQKAQRSRRAEVPQNIARPWPYIVADLKTMDRGGTEVSMAAEAGASAVVALGSAPTETLNAFIAECEAAGVDAMIDMMNVGYPLSVLRALKKQPRVVILHRGVDEEAFNKEKQIPLHEIRRIKGAFDIMISVAGGDTVREAQRSIFNDADIVVIWKSVYQNTQDTISLVEEFLGEVK
jgi:bifunctional enzyme Fae/Hps